MENEQWKYKVGGRAQGIIPSLFVIVLFGGISIYLFYIKHGAFLFTMLLTVIGVALLIACIYRAKFVKVLISEEGFYHQTKPGNGRFYKYSEISQAWQSMGRELNGTTGCFCSYETYEGNTIKFQFFPFEADGVDYLIQRVQEDGGQNISTDIEDTAKEYTIDGKIYGKTAIVATAVLLVLFLAMTIPAMLQIGPIGASTIGFGGLGSFVGRGVLLIGVILALLVVRYRCFKVKIGSTGFYFRSTPFNGRHYSYSDITNCRIEQKVYRHRRIGEPGSNHTLYYYYFIFTDKDGKTTKFQFQKPISGHEVEVLKKRIEQANGLSESDVQG